MVKENDQHYIHLVLKGDTNAFAVLVERYKDMVFTLSLKMLKDRHEAEEAAQDTFYKIYKSLCKFNGDSKFSTWIYKITFNACLDRLKKNKRLQVITSLDESREMEATSVLNVLDSIEEKERRQMIRDCLQLLPGEESFLLTLYYFEEQSLEEIAKIIGINPNNVKIRLYRSRKKLTVLMKERLEPESTIL
ncbi:sigma-70 family RNA polymerase sigma factor [Ginsengibacter hankyongi]|uniref:Sigma-70 family RNA polymerase sigma factor n=1 Tax=Ginsengibacter hankyongi TaxID=2607284 RepID=A0A5J5IBR4_9BACT|nr:sigma-70 family RNA polymerase sigma factor [Ginsengibacter hankyongi]KAA9035829.1 sigma-70 family RNA polymerase sigma factor [Ginsengibacter hankyongi]